MAPLKLTNDVIWVYAYNKLDDISKSNWFCMSYWVSPTLDQKWKPLGVETDDQIEDIGIKWNKQYESLRDVYKSYYGTKDEVIKWSGVLLERILPIAKIAIEKFDLFQSNEIDENEFLEYMQKNFQIVHKLYLESGNGKFPPYECNDYIQNFHSIFAIVDNMFFIHSKEYMNNWSKNGRILLMKKGISQFYKKLNNLNCEKNKIN